MRVTVQQDDVTAAIAKVFDYPFTGTTEFEPPHMPETPADFGLGLIVGPSGSGKSTLLARFGDEQDLKWDTHKAVCSYFSDADEAVSKLGAAGLNSIPTWLRPFHVLSTGEQFRAYIARQLRSGAVIDEFTSVVDRDVAKSASYALRRYVDSGAVSRVVLATCHYDVVEWLQPDWVFDTRTGKLSVGRGLRPEIRIDLVPCSVEEWTAFRQHHYLDGNINKGSRCWIARWGQRSVGFVSIIAFPNGNFKNAWRGHRTVVLPDFQGLGIGVRISDAVGEILLRSGARYFSKTAHPRMGAYRDNSPLWRPTSKNKKSRPDYATSAGKKEAGHYARHIERLCWSHEYVGVLR